MTNRKKLFNFNEHLQQNFWLYIISLFCIFTGIVLGIYAVKYMGDFDKNDLISYLNSFTQSISQGNFKYSSVFTDIIKNNVLIIAAIWFLGLTMVGIPIILIIDVIKGFTIGFTISFMIKGLGMKGIGIALLGVLPQNIIYIPCVILCSVFAMEFSLNLLRDRLNKQWTNSVLVKITSYTLAFAAILIFMFLGFIIETYITPALVKLIIA